MRNSLLCTLLLVGCTTDALDLTCRSMSSDAEQLTIEVGELTAGSFTPEDPFPAGAGEVIQSAEVWTSETTRWGADGGLDPDFPEDLVFVNRWVADGCDGRSFDYAGWREGDALRMVLVEFEAGELCDVDMPRIDLIQVARGGATDIAWCAPE